DRRVVLLALRGHRVDRPVRRDLSRSLSLLDADEVVTELPELDSKGCRTHDHEKEARPRGLEAQAAGLRCVGAWDRAGWCRWALHRCDTRAADRARKCGPGSG